jgi:hypothetical protein
MFRKTVRLLLLLAWLLLFKASPFVWDQLPPPHPDLNNEVKFEHPAFEQGDVAHRLQDSYGHLEFSNSNGLKKIPY